jgi:eukaryotic-like serine/threonine-protein kinase
MATESFSLFDLVPGKLVAGRYRIARPHRQSGLSATFDATDEPSGDRCELTVFPAALFDGPEQAEEYRQSLDPWKKVRSANVARVRELIALPVSNLLLATDFPGGSSLREWIKPKKRVDGPAVVRLGLAMCNGLTAIHKVGLVHGDIKPTTIFVAGGAGVTDSDAAASAQLVDGGITPGLWGAKHLGEHTALIGTPFYAPIEQFGGESPDVLSDVYNLATVLFEVTTGVLPWAGASFLEVFQAKLDKQPPSMRRRAPDIEVEPALERAIVGGLVADRRQRYATAAAFAAALSAVRFEED